MRESFTWQESNALEETDPTGRPAIWHGLIYVQTKEQLAALDRLKVYWSAMPISSLYLEAWKGRCGRVEHSSDGQGLVVYAIFPAKLYNLMREFGIQAENAQVALPFWFIIPSTPAQPEYVNSDGSLSYEGPGRLGYLQWLQSRPTQQPWFGSDWFDSASKWTCQAAIDTWEFLTRTPK